MFFDSQCIISLYECDVQSEVRLVSFVQREWHSLQITDGMLIEKSLRGTETLVITDKGRIVAGWRALVFPGIHAYM